MPDTLQVWFNGIETVVAHSEEDARKVIHESNGEPCRGFDKLAECHECCDGDSGWSVVDPAKVLKITEWDGHNDKTQTAELWQQQQGRGFLCSTEY